MTGGSHARRFRRITAGAAMVVAPPVIVLVELLHARFETDAAKQLEAVAAETARWYAAHVLVLLVLALAVPAYLGVVHLVGRTRAALGNVGLVLFVPGLVGLAAIVGMELVLWQMAQPEADRAEMVALAERLNESAGIVLVLVAALLFPVAWLLAGIGLYVTRVAPVWAAILIGASQPLAFVAELGGGPKWLVVGAQVAFALGLVPLGVRVLRKTDAGWEQGSAAGIEPATAG